LSAWTDSFYSITFNSRGQIFYGSDDESSVSITIDSFLDVEALKITSTSASLSSDVTSNFVVRTIKDAQIELSLEGATVVVASEILKSICIIDGLSNLQVTSTKIAYAGSSIELESSQTISALKFAFGSSSLSGEGDLLASATRIHNAGSNATVESEATTTSTRLATAKSTIEIEGFNLVLAKETLLAKALLEVETIVVAQVGKISFASITLSIDSDVTITTLEIVKAASVVEITSSISATAIEIHFAQCQIDGISFKVVVGKKIALLNAQLSAVATLLSIPAIRFSPSIVEDMQSIRPLLIIDGKPLTEHNRQIDITYVNQFVENVNWNSNKNRYYKKKKARKQYSVSWTYVPNSREKTVDQKHGRDTIRDIGKNPRVMNLKFLNIDSNGSNSYTEISHDVVVSSYSEKLIRRDVSDDTYYWDCNLSFEEV
jgi:hypothetical protein